MAEPPSAEELAVLPTARAGDKSSEEAADVTPVENCSDAQAVSGEPEAIIDGNTRLVAEGLALLPTDEAERAPVGPSVSVDPVSGDSIGRFVVREVLGRGGMGLVLSAHDPQLARQVAIKLVRPSAGGTDPEVKARLLREARAMAQFRHPNIVSVFEVGEHRGQVYVAMEQVDGGTLREVVQRMEGEGKHPNWRRVVDLFGKAGRGLAAAHATGMVHRDFKPDNVLIDLHDRVLVSDFGIVSQAGAGARGPEVTTGETLFSVHLTRAHEVVGTPAYMAPEQHTGDPVDARADQYSFCVSLYEALYGQLPFAGTTYPEYLEAVRCGALQAAPSGRRVPEWLRRLLVKGLAVDPAKRFASMEELLVELGTDPDQARGLGGRTRMAFFGGLAAFIIVWVASVAGLDAKLTYRLHYQTNSGFLIFLLVLGWFTRHALMRSQFNREAFYFVAAIAVATIVLVIGGQLQGIPADTIGPFHMLVIGTGSLAGVSQFGRQVIPMALCYLIGFMIVAARPEAFLPLLFSCHIVAGLTVATVFRSRPSA